MANTTSQCIASLARLSLAGSAALRPSLTSTIPRYLAPAASTSVSHIQQQTRWKGGSGANTMKHSGRAAEREKLKKKKRQARFKEYKYATPSMDERWSLCDAMRYIRATEVGRPVTSATYEIALRIRTIKNGPVIRNRIRLPYPVKNDTKIAVICPEGSSAHADARAAGAVAFGEESMFEMIKSQPNTLPFNRLICHVDSEAAMKKAGLGRILGPKGLMPSLKTNTITRSIKGTMNEMVGAETYREKIGVVRMPIGNIQFSPKQLSENVKTLVSQVKQEIFDTEDRCRKELVEVVLSSTQGPGFPLSGGFNATDKELDPAHLSGAM